MSYHHIPRLSLRHSSAREAELLGRPVRQRRPGDGLAPGAAVTDAPAPMSQTQVVVTVPSAAPTRFPLLTDVRTRRRHRRGMPSPVAI